MAPTRRKKVALLPMKPDYDKESLEFVKHRRSETDANGVSEEIQERCPMLPDDATAYQILDFFTTFSKCRRHMAWTTGPRLFQRFSLHLEGTHLTNWTAQVAGVNETVDNFNNEIQSYKDTLLQGYKYGDQIDSLRQMKKPRDQTPSQFLLALIAAESIAGQLPDAPDDFGFDDEEKKRVFYNAMPLAWQEKFDDANMRIETEAIGDIRIYMDKQQHKDPAPSNNNSNSNSGSGDGNNTPNSNSRRGRNRNRNNRGNSNGNNGGNNSQNRGNGNNRNNNSNRNNNNNNNKNGGARTSNNDQCPLQGHAGHLWGNCRSNRYGFQWERERGNNNNAGGNRNQGNRDAHQAEANNNRNANNNGNNAGGNNGSQQSNSNPQQGDSHFFCAEVNDVTSPTRDPESFFFAGDVQESFESEIYDQGRSVPDIIYEASKNLAAAEKAIREQMVPSTLAISKKINDKKGQFLFKSLLDPGGSHVLLNRRSLPKDTPMFALDKGNEFNTAAGGLATSHYVFLHDVILPEFSYNRRVKTVKAYVFDNENVIYDVIFGRNFLNSCGIDICGSDLTCKWYSDQIPFHMPDFFSHNERIREILEIPTVRVQQMEAASYMATRVTHTKDTFIPVSDVVESQKHLNSQERSELLAVLSKHDKLFDGTLGRYPKRKFHIELTPNAVPYHVKHPYPVPAHNMRVLKDELNRQVDLDILERVQESEWGMPMLVIPKKDGAIRTIDDFRELNKFIKRKCYPLPKIQDVFHRRKGFKYMTKLDLTLCYYTYELTEESSWLCVLVTPFGKYRRKRLPMGLTQSPDWSQAAIEDVLMEHDLLRECVEAYIDDVGVFSNSWADHLDHLDRTLYCLEENGYTVNPTKCEWCVAETEWLGHWMSTVGIKPLPKKIQGILALDRPQTVTQLRSFIGMINFYRDFWKRRAHVLAPLTKLTKLPKGKIPWEAEQDAAFKAIKAVLAEEVLLYYPDPNKEFIIEPDASKLQLGAQIYQLDNAGQKRPVAFFSRKLTPAQTRYPASDLEALCITEVFQEYRPILYGSQIRVRTDHKNLTARDLKSQRLLHWRLLLEEFSPTFEHLPGVDNVVGDSLSRLPMVASEEEKENPDLEAELFEALLFYPEELDNFPLQFPAIAAAQQADPAMLPYADDDNFEIQTFHGTELICRRQENTWKIVLPEELVGPTVEWYHILLGHCGITRLEKSLLTHLWFPRARARIQDFVGSCDDCQRNKRSGPGYGHLPPKNDVAAPWEEVAVDLIGPWTLRLPTGDLVVSAITMLDVTTTLAETIRIDNKTASHCAMQFENNWLSRYPKPLRCIHDQGTEFIGLEFQHMLAMNGIQSVPISVRNPQANAVCERMHKTVQDMLNTSLRSPPANVATAIELVDTCLAAASRALRSAVHQSMQISPGALVFNRDMLLPIPLMADYNAIRQRRQAIIDENNRRANMRRHFKDYHAGDKVLLVTDKLGKLAAKTEGPYTVIEAHVNGTITIERGEDVFERINIRRVKPYVARAG